MLQSFSNGRTINELTQDFDFSKVTIIRNLKKNLGEVIFKELINNRQKIKEVSINENTKETKHSTVGLGLDSISDELNDVKPFIENQNEDHTNSFSQFIEISPLDYEIEHSPQKDLSSVPISEIIFPDIVYMIVDKNIELETKFLKDFPEWQFLSKEELERKIIEIYFDLKIAKRFCSKDQKVIKVPNTEVFKIVAPLLLAKGI